MTFRKSSLSGPNGCVEINTDWQKSSYSNPNGCVEVNRSDTTIAVRDTKQNGEGPILEFNRDEWRAFIAGVKNGEFDIS